MTEILRPDLSWAPIYALRNALWDAQIWGNVNLNPGDKTVVVQNLFRGAPLDDAQVEADAAYVIECLRSEMKALHDQSLAEIKAANTRQLLAWLKSARACGGTYSPCDSKSDYVLRFEDLKAELDKREHVPNKHEAKASRKEAALQHRKNKLRRPSR